MATSIHISLLKFGVLLLSCIVGISQQSVSHRSDESRLIFHPLSVVEDNIDNVRHSELRRQYISTLRLRESQDLGDSTASSRDGVTSGRQQKKTVTKHQKETADSNIKYFNRLKANRLKDGEIITYNPGDKAPPFSLFTLDGVLSYPSDILSNKNLMFHVYDPEAGFMESLWHSTETLTVPLSKLPNNTHIIFMSSVSPADGESTAVWMRQQIEQGFHILGSSSPVRFGDVADRLHFVVTPIKSVGNWIPSVVKEWMCVDHNCGYSQVMVQSPDINSVLSLKRLDARYDWLPSPELVFPNKTEIPLVDAADGCLPSSKVNKSVAYVYEGGCSYFTKVAAMEKSGAVAVLVKPNSPGHIKDMNCEGEECSMPLGIPASMVPAIPSLIGDIDKKIFYQTTPSDNFHFAIDSEGKLAESGWWLFPSLKFLVWEAEWLNYKAELAGRLQQDSLVIPIFQSKVMQGQAGVVVNVTLPPIEKLKVYGKAELDMSLSCPGTRDTTCAHWDHTIQLFICCEGRPPQFCELEIGRWISPFRRRVGRWLTDITPLLPLLNGPSCTFTMKTAPWALPWVPSLNLRFSKPQSKGTELYPDTALSLYHPGATFDSKYNSNFPPIQFTVPQDVKKVVVYSVITGHGSDENGCGEFCVTSHHFNVNNITSNVTFSNAGTPEGCADHVPSGVIPNEHGTWLYGRDGWCDGQEVDPWLIDVTNHVFFSNNNSLHYYGWFNGTDPNPKKNPGIMILWSYLVYYKPLSS